MSQLTDKNLINRVIGSAEAEMLRPGNSEMLLSKGHVPYLTHSSMNLEKRLHNDLYCKQTHDGCIIAGSDQRETTSPQKFDELQNDESILHSRE